MKIEKRGKYPGVKVHLDKEECEMLLKEEIVSTNKALRKFLEKLSTKISKLKEEFPTLLDERTEEEITEVLEEEFKAAGDKLAAIEKGQDWKKYSK